MAFRNLDHRPAVYLREKARASGSNPVNLSQGQIAVKLATARVVVSQLLKKLEIEGRALLHRNQIKLPARL
jgi:CRP/FNR family transcriptional regulator, anaerobic regulatory protein